jgi:subtilisin family serine protease
LFALKRVGRVLLAVALTGSALAAFGPTTAAAGAEGLQATAVDVTAPGGPAASLVTLVTGDRIVVQGDGYTLLDNPARRDITFTSYRNAGHLNVIPSDALGLLGTRLDSRLFDVTALIEAGYTDGRDLGLIVEHGKSAKAAARSAVTRGGGRVARDLPAVGALAVKASQANPGGLWRELTTGTATSRQLRPDVPKIWLDGVRYTTLDQSVPQVGAPTAWAAGFDGTGVTVGIVDSGVDDTHPDLAGKVVASANFTPEAPQDLGGHGTHVASILAGTGAASGGQFRGVAPGAQLVSAKACVATGQCFESSIIDGMTWAANQGVKVINMSLGGPDMAGVDPLEAAVNSLTASHGVLFVVAAGNSAPPVPSFSVSSPSTADAALSVGAVDPGNGLAFFSNRGPRVGDTAIKPEITAPGLGITAARSSFSNLPGGQYTDLNGTSMASPHVAGGAAIVAQRHPTWTPAQLKAALMGTAFQPPNNTPVFDQGAGRLDVARAYNATVLADPPSVSLGRQVGPHGDDPVLNRTVTYTNTSTTSGVSLFLSLTTQAPGGGPAPAGMFALSTTSLSLPPGGTASVTLTATTSVSAPDGFYGGWVIATGQAGGVTVATPFAVHRSPAGKEITFNHLNRAGEFTQGYLTLLLPLTAGKPIYVIVSNLPAGPIGPRTEFIENGDYLFYNSIPEASTNFQDYSLLVQPKLTVDASTPSTFDLQAAQAQPVNITVPNNASTRTFVMELGAGYPSLSTGVTFNGRAQVYTKQLGPPNVFTFGFMAKVNRVAYIPVAGTSEPHNAPTMYNVAWFPEQQFPTGFTRNVTAGQLARRDVSVGRNTAGAVGFKGATAHPGGTLFNSFFTSDTMSFDLPFSRTEFYNTEGNIRWFSTFFELHPVPLEPAQFVVTLESALTAFTAGTTTAEAWNKPVYGPSLGSVVKPEDWVSRKGNTISFLPPMLGDSGGHTGHAWWGNFAVPGTTGQSVLKRNGVVVATAAYPSDPFLPRPSATVPPEWSPYTLETTVSRGGPTELATQVSAVWSFFSSSVDPNATLRLPLWTVTLKPNLNASNTAPPGSFAVPLTAVAQPWSPVAGMNTITVQYSTNDGATWQNATVTGLGNNRTATVTNPASGFVSLRVTATDFAGNSVTQTTIRAYQI